jgi:membrane protease YdiL (CAAX protease family)
MQSLLSFLIFLPFLALVVVANLGEQRPWARYTTYALLVLTDLALLGVAALAVLSELVTRMAPDVVPALGLNPSWPAAAVVCFVTALLAALALVPAVRRWIAHILPIDPGSIVHMTVLAFAVYEVGLSLGQMALIGDLSNLVATGMSLSVWDVLLSELPLLLFAVLGVGMFVRRSGVQVLERLGLRVPNWKQLLLAIVLVGVLLAFDYGVNATWERLDPAGYGSLVKVTDQLFGGLMSVGGAIVLGLAAGIGEELLFRGAIQPRLGLLLAAGLFAIGHLQYGMTIATLEVFVIGLVLGLVRKRTNTTTAILIHAGYNMAGVLLGLLKP